MKTVSIAFADEEISEQFKPIMHVLLMIFIKRV